MTFMLIGIIAGIALEVALIWWASRDCETSNMVAGILACFLGGALCLFIGVFTFFAWEWTAAKYKVNIINREYDTSYTREELFYAKDVIETIKQLDRSRLEIQIKGDKK